VNGCRYFGRKEKTRNRKENWKTPTHGKKVKEKASDTNGLCAQELKIEIDRYIQGFFCDGTRRYDVLAPFFPK